MPREINWEAVARSRTHPIQLRILDHLAEGPADSPNGMRQKFGEPLGNVSYHVGALFKAGLLTLSDTKPRRGVLEHFYELSKKATQR